MRAYTRSVRSDESLSLSRSRGLFPPRAVLHSNSVQLQERNYANLRTETMSSLPPREITLSAISPACSARPVYRILSCAFPNLTRSSKHTASSLARYLTEYLARASHFTSDSVARDPRRINVQLMRQRQDNERKFVNRPADTFCALTSPRGRHASLCRWMPRKR